MTNLPSPVAARRPEWRFWTWKVEKAWPMFPRYAQKWLSLHPQTIKTIISVNGKACNTLDIESGID